MEIFEEEDEEIKQLMLRISNKEITLCETCDTLFDYIPQKLFCDECLKKREREYENRPEVKKRKREHAREYRKSLLYERWQREYSQRPEVKERRRKFRESAAFKNKRNKYARERYHRLKKLREEE